MTPTDSSTIYITSITFLHYLVTNRIFIFPFGSLARTQFHTDQQWTCTASLIPGNLDG
jgi:hypothetical protein